MVDLSRYRALVRVLGGVVLVLVVIDVALRLALGITPPALLRATFHNTGNRAEVAARASGVVSQQRRGAANERPVAVIVGSSSAVDGLLPTLLDRSDPAGHRWLNLATTGSSFDELSHAFGPLFASGLRADLVVLAVHPGWLAGRVVGDPGLDALMLPDLPRTSWLLFHRGTLQHLARSAIGDTRERLLLALGVRFESIYPPAADPWHQREQPRTYHQDLGPNQLNLWRKKRWFDAAWFEQADDEIATAAEVIAACRRIGRRVVVVLMPESSMLRREVPATADAALARALTRAGDPPLLDLRTAIPDAELGDHIHVGAAGAQRLGELLPRRIADM